MNTEQTTKFIDHRWDESILPQLINYIRIPNKSPMFDPEWQANGYMDQAVELMVQWCEEQNVEGMALDVIRLPERTPLIFIDIPGQGERTVLLYGHLDKQPEMTGWRDGLGPWIPVVEDDKLYGRGGADDGYAIFGSLAAVMALKEQDIPHANLKIVIEASEESGSPDLPAYMQHLSERIGSPELVICLDSGCGNYDQLWCTTSLRGVIGGTLRVDVLDEGVHSGDAGGIVPSSFRVLRQLLDRIEDEKDGRVLLPELHVDIPPERSQQAEHAAQVLGEKVYNKFPFTNKMQPANGSLSELVLNRTWRPSVEITGVDGIPPIDSAGNVLRPSTAVKLSVRIPPTCNAENATQLLKETLENDPPYQAAVSFGGDQASDGWNAPPLAEWLADSVNRSSLVFFDKPAVYMGEGGTIPFMAMLGERFPDAQFLNTGVLGPQSNAHGPNEFLHIPTGKRVTACVAQVIADHYDATS